MHYHNYKVINDTQEGKVEVCIECKHRLSTRKDVKTGRIDNKKYLKEHIRDTAQPFGKTGKLFRKFYGDDAQYIDRYKR